MKCCAALASLVVATSHAAECTLSQLAQMEESMLAAPWANCTSKGFETVTSIRTLIPVKPEKIALLCSIPTCMANLNAFLQGVPECLQQGTNPKEMYSKGIQDLCVNVTIPGGACAPSQLVQAAQLLLAPVPATCSSAAGIPATTVVGGLLNQSKNVLCNAACIGAVTGAAASSPNCTVDGKLVNDATPYTKVCSAGMSVSATMLAIATAILAVMT